MFKTPYRIVQKVYGVYRVDKKFMWLWLIPLWWKTKIAVDPKSTNWHTRSMELTYSSVYAAQLYVAIHNGKLVEIKTY